MRKYPLAKVSEALKELRGRGWTMKAITETVKLTGLSVVELAEKVR